MIVAVCLQYGGALAISKRTVLYTFKPARDSGYLRHYYWMSSGDLELIAIAETVG